MTPEETAQTDLPILTEAERHQLLVEWNDTQADYPQNQCTHQLFEAQVERTPEAVAVVFEDQKLTYQELNSRANQLAHYLQALGVGPEVLVGICLERSLEMVVGLLGILKAGGAYVPLDPAYPSERLTLMLSDCQAPVLLTQKTGVAGLPETGARVVCLDADWGVISQESEENPVSGVKPENLVYVIYTSGSTGRPKGVQISHHSLGNFLNSMGLSPGLTDQDILLAVTTISFDIAALELYLPLIVGAQVVLASRSVASDGSKLLERLVNSGATAMQATPATWRLLLAAGWSGSYHLKILCGGEALTRELANRLLEKGTSVWNLYGPTEATIWSAAYQVESEDGSVSIGKPIANTQIYLLDSHLQPVPIGVPGELHIGGAGLARGYLNRPELTEEKFIPNPFDKAKGKRQKAKGMGSARLYKTGDLARYLPDGNIEFLGRRDHQVKIRGFRIELSEVESALAQHPAVQQTVVMVREDVPGDKRLVAYIVPNDPSSIFYPKSFIQNQLRRFLRRKLPDYMVPSAFVLLDALPLTPNGKVDRRALPAPDRFRPEPEETFVAPRNELELQLTKIWEQVLGTHPVGVRDNFFDLGGHSLLAVPLFAQIEKETDKKLPPATLFQAPTIEQLASLLRAQGWSPPWSELVAIQPGGLRRPFFCVHGAGGHVLNYYSLARHLGPEQPFYGLQAQGLDGKQPFHTKVEEMAAHYIKEMLALQPEGPYFLGGYCGGGTIAFEMAQQLRARGQQVALLALFNTYNWSKSPPANSFPDRLYSLVKDIECHWRNLSLLEPKEKLTFLLERAQWGQRRLMAQMIARSAILPLVSLGKLHDQLAMNYVPQVYQGRLTLFLTRRLKASDQGPQVGWSGLAAGGIEVHEVPAYFRGMLVEPFVRSLAEQLRTCLKRAEEE